MPAPDQFTVYYPCGPWLPDGTAEWEINISDERMVLRRQTAPWGHTTLGDGKLPVRDVWYYKLEFNPALDFQI